MSASEHIILKREGKKKGKKERRKASDRKYLVSADMQNMEAIFQLDFKNMGKFSSWRVSFLKKFIFVIQEMNKAM